MSRHGNGDGNGDDGRRHRVRGGGHSDDGHGNGDNGGRHRGRGGGHGDDGRGPPIQRKVAPGKLTLDDVEGRGGDRTGSANGTAVSSTVQKLATPGTQDAAVTGGAWEATPDLMSAFGLPEDYGTTAPVGGDRRTAVQRRVADGAAPATIDPPAEDSMIETRATIEDLGDVTEPEAAPADAAPEATRDPHRAATTIDRPEEESMVETRATIDDASESPSESGRKEPGWVVRARAYHRAHPVQVRRFNALTANASADGESVDPQQVARWQEAHGVRPDGRVGHATLRAARRAGGGNDGAVQRNATAAPSGASDVHAAAADGVRGAGSTLPHLETIQRSFGPDHDLSQVQAHVGGDAAEAASAIGAEAYATGNKVAFAGPPSLHTAAHEAAHVVQQQQGVQLKGGVGQAGDVYEQQADAIADRVVSGKSAADLLPSRAHGAGTDSLQRKPASEVEHSLGNFAAEAAAKPGEQHDFEAGSAQVYQLFGTVKGLIVELSGKEKGSPEGVALAQAVEHSFVSIDAVLQRIEPLADESNKSGLREMVRFRDGLRRQAITTLKGHIEVKTGIALVDDGLACERPDAPIDGCFLTEDKRAALITSLKQGVNTAMGNFSMAIMNSRLKEAMKKDPGSWGFLAEMIFIGASSVLINCAMKGIRGLQAAGVAANTVDSLQIMRGEETIKTLTNRLLTFDPRAAERVLVSASKGVRSAVKSKLGHDKHQPPTGLLEFMQAKVKGIADSIVVETTTMLDDYDLVAMANGYLDADAHSIGSYQEEIDALLAQYEGGVGRLGHVDFAHNIVNHKLVRFVNDGHERLAVIGIHGPEDTGETTMGGREMQMDSGGREEFVAWADGDLGGLAAERQPEIPTRQAAESPLEAVQAWRGEIAADAAHSMATHVEHIEETP